MQPEWTSVDVALPPQDPDAVTGSSVDVLTWDGANCTIAWHDSRPGGVWWSPGSVALPIRGVTHWMPLPDPPNDGHLDPHQADTQ